MKDTQLWKTNQDASNAAKINLSNKSFILSFLKKLFHGCSVIVQKIRKKLRVNKKGIFLKALFINTLKGYGTFFYFYPCYEYLFKERKTYYLLCPYLRCPYQSANLSPESVKQWFLIWSVETGFFLEEVRGSHGISPSDPFGWISKKGEQLTICCCFFQASVFYMVWPKILANNLQHFPGCNINL